MLRLLLENTSVGHQRWNEIQGLLRESERLFVHAVTTPHARSDAPQVDRPTRQDPSKVRRWLAIVLEVAVAITLVQLWWAREVDRRELVALKQELRNTFRGVTLPGWDCDSDESLDLATQEIRSECLPLDPENETPPSIVFVVYRDQAVADARRLQVAERAQHRLTWAPAADGSPDCIAGARTGWGYCYQGNEDAVFFSYYFYANHRFAIVIRGSTAAEVRTIYKGMNVPRTSRRACLAAVRVAGAGLLLVAALVPVVAQVLDRAAAWPVVSCLWVLPVILPAWRSCASPRPLAMTDPHALRQPRARRSWSATCGHRPVRAGDADRGRRVPDGPGRGPGAPRDHRPAADAASRAVGGAGWHGLEELESSATTHRATTP